MALFLRDKYSKVKNQAIPLLIGIIQITSTSKMADELKIQSVIEKFFMEMTKATKHSSTGKFTLIFRLHVLSKHPNEVKEENILNW